MNIIVSDDGRYKSVRLNVDENFELNNGEIDLGVYSDIEAQELAEELIRAANELLQK